jgi:Xaa-Pro aminopeptidase
VEKKQTDIVAALTIAEKVYAALCEACRPGATEDTLDAVARLAADGHELQYDLLTGPRTAQIEGGATGRVLRRGDPVLLDLCLKAGEHWCDVCRVFFLGEATPEAGEAYAVVRECHLMLAGLLRAGVWARALYETAEAFLAEHGMKGWVRHHAGHAIGAAPFQPPVLLPGSDDILAVGDVVTVEIGVYNDQAFGIRLEEDYWITQTGAQGLWKEPKTLREATLFWPDEKQA